MLTLSDILLQTENIKKISYDTVIIVYVSVRITKEWNGKASAVKRVT